MAIKWWLLCVCCIFIGNWQLVNDDKVESIVLVNSHVIPWNEAGRACEMFMNFPWNEADIENVLNGLLLEGCALLRYICHFAIYCILFTVIMTLVHVISKLCILSCHCCLVYVWWIALAQSTLKNHHKIAHFSWNRLALTSDGLCLLVIDYVYITCTVILHILLPSVLWLCWAAGRASGL